MRTRRTNASGPEAPREDLRASLFSKVILEVPQIFDLVPTDSAALNLACTCWDALLSLLMHGRRVEEGDCEWVRDRVEFCANRAQRPTIPSYTLKLTTEQRIATPVRSIAPRGALLHGLADRIRIGSQYVGQLEFAGARFALQDALALHRAASKASANNFGTSDGRFAALAQMLDASRQPGALPLHVLQLDAPMYFFEGARHSGLTRQDHASALASVLSSPAVHAHVRRLGLRGLHMTDALASEVLEKLHGAPCLEVLDLSDNVLRPSGARAVAGAVETLTGLRELDIGHDLDGVALAPILQAVLKSGTVKIFKAGCTCLRNCTHVDVVADMLARYGTGALERVEGLPILGLAANGDELLHLTLNDQKQASEARMQALTNLLGSTSTLRSLEARNVYVSSRAGTEECTKLLEAAATNPLLHLERLVLSEMIDCNASFRAVARLVARHSSTLLELVLVSPSIRPCSPPGVGPHQLELAAALNGNTTLRRLDVCGIATTNEILRELTKAVASCKLTEFRMLDIKVHRVFVELDVLGNLFASTTLRCIEVGVPYLKPIHVVFPTGVDNVVNALATNSVLRILTLDLPSSERFSFGSGLGALARALRTNTALRSLTVKAVFPDNRGAQLADALCDNRSLRFLDLRDYGDAAGQKTKRSMIKALRVNRTLQRVNINGCRNDPPPPESAHWNTSIGQVPGPFPRLFLA